MAVGANALAAKTYAPLLEKARVVAGDSFLTITSKAGVAMLVAQGAVESAYYKRTQEDLTYSVDALKSLKGNKGRYFTDEQAEKYGYIRRNGAILQQANQRMIANLYYGGRLGNLGVDTDDGWTFKGLTLIQLTGRYNITRWAESCGISVERALDWGTTPEGAVSGLLWYWRNHGLLVPASRGNVPECTRIIQGGSSHLDKRTELFNAALRSLG